MTSVVTSFSRNGLHEYGNVFIETFDAFWPAEVGLVLYVEHDMPVPASVCGRRIEVRQLDQVVSFQLFMKRYGSDPLYQGRVETPVWKSKDRVDGYSFRTDAAKFCRKVFAVQHAANQDHQQGVMAWIDADVRCLKPVPKMFLEALIGPTDCAFLGRERAHSECGFLIFRLPQALPVIKAWAWSYASGMFAKEREWHDSYLFDLACTGVVARNLTPGGKGHVWCDSPLALYMDHMKGLRKKLGYSPELKSRLAMAKARTS